MAVNFLRSLKNFINLKAQIAKRLNSVIAQMNDNYELKLTADQWQTLTSKNECKKATIENTARAIKTLIELMKNKPEALRQVKTKKTPAAKLALQLFSSDQLWENHAEWYRSQAPLPEFLIGKPVMVEPVTVNDELIDLIIELEGGVTREETGEQIIITPGPIARRVAKLQYEQRRTQRANKILHAEISRLRQECDALNTQVDQLTRGKHASQKVTLPSSETDKLALLTAHNLPLEVANWLNRAVQVRYTRNFCKEFFALHLSSQEEVAKAINKLCEKGPKATKTSLAHEEYKSETGKIPAGHCMSSAERCRFVWKFDAEENCITMQSVGLAGSYR